MANGFIELHGMSRPAADKYIATRKALERERTKAEVATQKAVSSVEAFMTGLGIGFAETYYDSFKEPFGIPLPILIGVGAHLVELAAPSRSYDEHLNNIGNAGLAIYGGDLGREFANTKKSKEAGTTTTTA
jgi:hypothetical protein